MAFTCTNQTAPVKSDSHGSFASNKSGHKKRGIFKVQKTTISAISVLCLLKESKPSTVNVSGILTVQCMSTERMGDTKRCREETFTDGGGVDSKNPCIRTHSRKYTLQLTRRQGDRNCVRLRKIKKCNFLFRWEKKHVLCNPCASCHRNLKHEANRLPAKACMADGKVWYGVSWHEKLNASTYFCYWSASTNINTLCLERKKENVFFLRFRLLFYFEFQTHAVENGINVKLQQGDEKGAKLTKSLNVAFRSPCRCGEKRFVVTRTPDWLRGRNTR